MSSRSTTEPPEDGPAEKGSVFLVSDSKLFGPSKFGVHNSPELNPRMRGGEGVEVTPPLDGCSNRGGGGPIPLSAVGGAADEEGSRSSCAAGPHVEAEESSSAPSSSTPQFEADERSWSAFTDSLEEERAEAPGGEQQKGHGQDGGSPTARSGAVGEAPCHPLAKKCEEWPDAGAEGDSGGDGASGEVEESGRRLSMAQYWRKRRYRRREVVWEVTRVERCAYCGRVPHSADQSIKCYREEGSDGQVSAHVEGMQTCGNVKLCPVCARGPRQRRAAMINEAVENHLRGGGGVLEFLFTLKHDGSHSLREQMEAMQEGWTAMMQPSQSWAARKVREKMGHVGHYWANEAPWNASNGWHLHRHGILMVEEPLDAEEISEIEDDLYHAYKDAVMASGMPCPSKEFNRVRDIRDGAAKGPDEIGGYLMKTDAKGRSRTGQEITRGDAKAEGKGLMPFQILDRIAEAQDVVKRCAAKVERARQAGGETKWSERGERRARTQVKQWVALWREYEAVVEGETMMQASQDFEETFCVTQEDEGGGTDAGEEEREKVGEIEPHIYRHLCRFAGGISTLFETIEGVGRIRREGNRIVAVGEGEHVDFGELIEALRLDWWHTEVDETEAESPTVGVQYLNRTKVQ